jgi:DNA ligase (NAD+)
LEPLERFAEKSAENLINSIQDKKEISLSRFIYALGIRNIGEQTAIDLAEKFGSISKIKNAKLEDFESVEDIGPIVSRSVYEWLQDKSNLKYLDKLEKSIKVLGLAKSSAIEQKLAGKTFVLTGSLEAMTRDDAKAKIRELGGDVSSYVSSKTDYVVLGSDPGTKADRAQKIGVKTITEEEFLQMIK